MNKIKDYLHSVTPELTLNEKKGDAVVFTFGRFNPPTSGHEKLIDAVKRVAKKTRAEHRIYPSHSEDVKKNPLSHKVKVKYMRKFYKGANIVDDRSAVSPFHVCKHLSDKGYKHVILVVGGDRVEELKKLISQYINHPDPKKSFNFDKFEVVSAGNRDPDSEGISGMSASKMRAAAGAGDLESFKRGLPSSASDKDARDIFTILRKSMGLKESLDEGVKDIIKKLSRIPSVIRTIKRTANLSALKVTSALIAIPAVSKIMTPDNMNKSTIVVNNLRRTILGEETQLLREPEILDRLVSQLKAKGMDNDKAHAVARSQLSKHGILKKGSEELTDKGKKRNSMSAGERAKDRAAKKDGSKPSEYKYNKKTNLATKKESIELDEISRQARLKMSRAAKRSAKKRMASRKRKQKRLKGSDQMKTKAQKGAKNVFRSKLLKGRKWSDLSYTERETVDKRLKKINPQRLQTIAKKLLPGLRQAERDRIAKLRGGGDSVPTLPEEKERDYKKEYQNYHGKPEQIKRRAKRVQARRDLEKTGRVSRGDGKDVDHKDGNPLNNSGKNLRVTSVAHNRSRNNNKGRTNKQEELAKGSSGKKQLEVGTDLTRDVYSGAVPGQKKTIKDFLKRGKKNG